MKNIIRKIKLWFANRRFKNNLQTRPPKEIYDKMQAINDEYLKKDREEKDGEAQALKIQLAALKWVLNLCVLVCLLFIPLQVHADLTSGQKIEYDDDITGNSKEYFGWARKDSATTSAVWKIMRITYTGSDFVIEWAGGTEQYIFKWSERTTLSYS